jgi:hypothetical protein
MECGKAKRLQASLCSPHGRNGGSLGAHGGRTNVEHDFNRSLFFEGFRQLQNAAIDRELVEAGSNLALIVELKEHQDRSR